MRPLPHNHTITLTYGNCLPMIDFFHPIGVRKPSPYASLDELWTYVKLVERYKERAAMLGVFLLFETGLAVLNHVW